MSAAVNVSSFGPLEPSASRLLERSRAITGFNQALDIIHVTLAALNTDESDPDTAETTPACALLRQVARVEQLRPLLTVELSLHADGTTPLDGISAPLRRCMGIWRQVMATRDIRPTDALVLWAILSDDNTVSRLMGALQVDLPLMLRQLEALFQSDALPDVEEERMAPRIAPTGLDEEEIEEYEEASEQTHIVKPSPDSREVGKHAVLMSNVLNVLGSLRPPDIAVLVGRNGTPLDDVKYVLADRLAGNEAFTGQRERLSHYRAVHRLNVASVLGLADIPDEPEPQGVLEMAMAQAVEDQAVLVLENLEALGQEGEAEAAMLGQLSLPGDALILGIYELADRGEVGVEQALKMKNIRQISSREYSAEQTKSLIFEYYAPEWEADGYTFTPDAFDSVIALEPGAWIEARRKTLPYLAVGLGNDAIQTLRDGAPLIKEMAQMALDALVKLKQEAATTDERIRDQFTDVLEQARQDIEALRADPQPRLDHGRYVVTRAHLTMQLICPNDSEFHYPGHLPPQQRLYRLDDLPSLQRSI